MARNEKNLIPNSERTPQQLREMTRKAGIASGEARRRKRTMREIAQMIGESPVKNKEAVKKICEVFGIESEEVTNDFAVVAKQYLKAEKGDIQSARYISDLKGELRQSVEVTGAEGKPLIPQRMTDEELKEEIERLNGIGKEK